MPILVIVGPTAVGKTTTAEIIAKNIGGEIISADSRQIYKKLSVGTAKPTDSCIKYHLIDIIEPTERYDAARFVSDALSAIDKITSRKKIPIIVGGTGLYIRALTVGLFPGEFRDDEIRRQLKVRHDSGEDLYKPLCDIDPKAAEKIAPQNYVRIERALEVFLVSGKPISYWWDNETKPPSELQFVKIGLSIERKELYRRIERRVEEMLENGWVGEVQKLLDSGIPKNASAFNSIGYGAVLRFIEGEISQEEMREQIIKDTKRYAKRQITWFKKEPNVRWLDVTELSAQETAEQIQKSRTAD